MSSAPSARASTRGTSNPPSASDVASATISMGNQLFELMSVRTVMSLGLGPIYPCTLSCFNIVSFLCASERHVFFFFFVLEDLNWIFIRFKIMLVLLGLTKSFCLLGIIAFNISILCSANATIYFGLNNQV